MKRIDPSPPKGNGALAGAGPKKQNDSTRKIPDTAPSCNRQLLEKAGDARLWAESQGRRTVYRVVSGENTWEFNLLFPAISKFDRLSRRKGAAQP
jgi:hypothetical protein